MSNKTTGRNGQTNGSIDPAIVKDVVFKTLSTNARMSGRGAFWTRRDGSGNAGMQYGGDRDLYHVLGYKRELRFDDFLSKYDRQDIAGTLIDLPPEDTWRDMPQVYDGTGDNKRDDTPFTVALTTLFDRLDALTNFENADALAGIGRYGVLLIGTAGEAALNEPVERLSAPTDIIYLSSFDESHAAVSTVDKVSSSPRFGLPELYTVDFGAKGVGSRSVHHSRIVHIAERARRSRIYGTPRLQGVYNRLDDLEKVVGGSAEAFWKLVYKGIIATTKDGFALPSDGDDKNELEAMVQDYVNDMRRFMVLDGMDVQELGSQTVDPSAMVDVIMSIIAAKTGIPKRILMGSERGELASSQDAGAWAGRITTRRNKFAEPIILREFVDRLLLWGVLPRPQNGGYCFEWKPLFELSETEQAAINKTKAETLNIVSGGMPQDMADDNERRELAGLPARQGVTIDDLDIDAILGGQPDPLAEIDGLLTNVEFRRVTYNGVTVQATRIRPSSRDDKKYMVMVKDGDSERVVHFGDPNLDMQRDRPDRRKAFNDRHSCGEKKDPFAPGFWACYAWEPDTEIP